MMRTNRWAVTLLAASVALGARAQTYTYDFRGIVNGQSDFLPTEMLTFSRTDYSMGSARSAAMGGAFTSLGADLSTMSINPAGLGMYRGSAFGITPSVVATSADNHGLPGWGKNSRTRFNLSNLGAAVEVYTGSGALTSVTLGFGYNKLADYNFRSSFSTPTSNASVADFFARQLNGVRSGTLGGQPWADYRPELWGSILAYKNYLIDPVEGADDNTLYFPGSLFEDADVAHHAEYVSRGHLGEYTIAAGLNWNDIFFLGLTLGLQDIHQERTIYYGEDYTNNGLKFGPGGEVTGAADQVPSAAPLILSDYAQSVRTNGLGINFKIGAIVRPVKGLRIGVALHTPTWMNIDRSYQGFMYTKAWDLERWQPVESAADVQYTYEYRSKVKYNTPTHLLLGASYTFGQIGILSFDYERVWYNGMRKRGDSQAVKEYFKDFAKNEFRSANNIRIGAEVRPLPFVAVRAGYAHNGSLLKDERLAYDNPVAYRSENYSAGLGFTFGNVNLDLAYVYTSTRQTAYELFSVQEYVNGAAGYFASGGAAATDYKRHQVILSLGVRIF